MRPKLWLTTAVITLLGMPLLAAEAGASGSSLSGQVSAPSGEPERA